MQADRARTDILCELAVEAVMRHGAFETSGPARLAVLRRSGLMVAYHTPFNPLPPLNDETKYRAAMDGRLARLQPYGIDIWYENLGKVFRAGWRTGEGAIVDFYRPGDWESLFETLGACAASAPTRKHIRESPPASQRASAADATSSADSGKTPGRNSRRVR